MSFFYCGSVWFAYHVYNHTYKSNTYLLRPYSTFEPKHSTSSSFSFRLDRISFVLKHLPTVDLDFRLLPKILINNL